MKKSTGGPSRLQPSQSAPIPPREYGGLSITREDLTPERLERIKRRIKEEGLFEPLTDEERENSLKNILSQSAPGNDLWIFGYGSLMWNPMVYYQEERHGLVYGHHRRYCFYTRSGRGTPEMPGLGLGMDRGGSCHGMAFRIAAKEAEPEMRLLWLREMISGIYIPTWVTVHTAHGALRAVTFLINRHHKQYVTDLPLQKAARHIALAAGWLGTCRSYLENTVAHLSDLGISDSYLSSLHKLVRQEAGE